VLLSISLIAMIASCVLLYYDVKRYPKIVPDANVTTPALALLLHSPGVCFPE
jgi:hypothetical protein